MVAPVGLAICKKLKMNPVGMILSIAVSSNLQGAATLVGDTTLGIEPHLLYFGLLSGATLGGNITPIGASANIAAVGLLRKEGYQVSFGEFMRIRADRVSVLLVHPGLMQIFLMSSIIQAPLKKDASGITDPEASFFITAVYFFSAVFYPSGNPNHTDIREIQQCNGDQH